MGEQHMSGKNKVHTDIEEIKNRIYEDYRKYDTELNSLFFDFRVKASKKALLEAYAEIQHTINGDYVIRLEDPEIEKINDCDSNIWGKEVDLIPEGEYEDIYCGNYRDFLESFNDKELETGLCRVMESEERGDLIGGEKLDFIF